MNMEDSDKNVEENKSEKATDSQEDTVDFAAFLAGDDVTPEVDKALKQIIAFALNPSNYERLTDPQVPYAIDVSAALAWLASKIPTGFRFETDDIHQEKTRVVLDKTTTEAIKAAQYFVAKSMLTSGADHYRVLGLKVQASVEEIQNNYRYLRRIFSPSEGIDSAQMCVMRISDAYVTLRDPTERNQYNSQLFGKQSNVYVSHVKPAMPPENSGSKKQGKSIRRWPRYTGRTILALIALGGMAYWSLQPDLPPVSSSGTLDNTISNSDDLNQPTTIEDVLANLEESGVDTSLLEDPSSLNQGPLDSDVSFPPDEDPFEPVITDEPLPDLIEDVVVEAPIPEPEVAPVVAVPEPEPAPEPVVVPTPEPQPVVTTPVVQTPPEPVQPVAPVTPTVSDKEKRVQELLKEAQEHLEASRLTQPSGNNAFVKFKAVLAMDSGNLQARDGLEKIADRYVSLARFRVNNNRYDEAQIMVNRGMNVLPNYPPLLSLEAEINALTSTVEQVTPEPEPVVEVVTPVTPPAIVEPEPAPVVIEPVTEPEPAPEPEVVRAPYQDEQGLVREEILDELIETFITYYEQGDIGTFMSLFADNARSNNRGDKAGIQSDYQALFSTTESRLMRIRGMKWKRSDLGAMGDGDFRLSVFRTGDSRPKTFEGSLTFQVEVVEGELVISGLFHSQDKVNR